MNAEKGIMISPPLDSPGGPDPLALAESIGWRTITYELATGGTDRGIDALVIVCKVLEPLNEDERAALLAYVSSRYSSGS